MNLTERLYEMTSDVRDQAGAYAARAADVARDSVDRAASRVDAVTTPVEKLADAGQELNNLAHAYFGRAVALQARVVQKGLDEAASRLRMLAKADSLKHAYGGQVEATAGTRERVMHDANEALEMVVDAGRGVSELALRTYADMLRDVKRTARPARAKAVKGRKAAKRKVARVRKAA